MLKKESQKVWVGKDLQGPLVPSPPWAGTPSTKAMGSPGSCHLHPNGVFILLNIPKSIP